MMQEMASHCRKIWSTKADMTAGRMLLCNFKNSVQSEEPLHCCCVHQENQLGTCLNVWTEDIVLHSTRDWTCQRSILFWSNTTHYNMNQLAEEMRAQACGKRAVSQWWNSKIDQIAYSSAWPLIRLWFSITARYSLDKLHWSGQAILEANNCDAPASMALTQRLQQLLQEHFVPFNESEHIRTPSDKSDSDWDTNSCYPDGGCQCLCKGTYWCRLSDVIFCKYSTICSEPAECSKPSFSAKSRICAIEVCCFCVASSSNRCNCQQVCLAAVTTMKGWSPKRSVVAQKWCTATLLASECMCCGSLLFHQTGCQHVCLVAVTAMKSWSPKRSAVAHQRCTATLLASECMCCGSLLFHQIGCQQVCLVAVTAMKACSSKRFAAAQQWCTATLLASECMCCGSLLFHQIGCQQVCLVAVTAMKAWSPKRSAVAHQRCTATLLASNYMPCGSLLFCQTDCQQVCLVAVTAMKACSSERSAVPHHQIACLAAHCYSTK